MPPKINKLGQIAEAFGTSLIGSAAQLPATLLQRHWQLQDEARYNEYNSPKEQMKRFRDAGLNPNLIYGQTSSMQGAQAPRPESRTEGMSAYMNMELLRQQVRIARADASIRENDKEISDRETYIKMTGLDSGYLEGEEVDEQGYPVEKIGSTLDYLSSMYGENRRKDAETERFNYEMREVEKNKKSIEIRHVGETIKNLEQQYKNLKATEQSIYLENKLKELEEIVKQKEAELAKRGIFKSDNIYDRVLLQNMSDFEFGLLKFLEQNLGGMVSKVISGGKLFKK